MTFPSFIFIGKCTSLPIFLNMYAYYVTFSIISQSQSLTLLNNWLWLTLFQICLDIHLKYSACPILPVPVIQHKFQVVQNLILQFYFYFLICWWFSQHPPAQDLSPYHKEVLKQNFGNIDLALRDSYYKSSGSSFLGETNLWSLESRIDL